MDENLITAINWTMQSLKNAPDNSGSFSSIVLGLSEKYKKVGKEQQLWGGKVEAALRYLKDAKMISEVVKKHTFWSLTFLGYEWESYEKFVEQRNEESRIRLLQNETSEKQNRLLKKTLTDYDTVQARAQSAEKRAKWSIRIAVGSIILSLVAILVQYFSQ